MKTVQWLLIAAVVMGMLAMAVAYKSSKHKSTTEALAPVEQKVIPQEPAPAPEPQTLTATRAAAGELQGPVAPPPAEPRLPMVDLASDMPLATVNEITIRTGDLMPISESAASVSLRADAFRELLDRAIDRELTFQTAKTLGLILPPEQLAEVERVRAEALARTGAPYTLPGYNGDAQAAFEAREREAQLLQNLLLGETDRPGAPATDEQIQQYYNSHPDEFPPLPRALEAREKAWAAIAAEIQARLVRADATRHEEARRRILADMRSQAKVDIRVSAPAR